MGVLVDSEDFVGVFNIPQGSFDTLTETIEEFEESYLVDLLGAKLYKDFKANLTAQVPVAANYLLIYNPFIEEYCNANIVSNGMKKMLLGFLFFEYMRKAQFKVTQNGVTTMPSDGSKIIDNSFVINMYNEAIMNYISIQNYIVYINPSVFNTIAFNGVYKSTLTPW